MAEQKKLVAEITSMDEDFTQWYTDVVVKAGLVAYSHIKGFLVYKPAGYALWEAVQNLLDARFKKTGVENVYMPLLIPENLMAKEGDLVNGFAPEVAWVTAGGSEPLQERLCVRPTSETVFSDFFRTDVQSYRDLPKVYNQWCSVVRWEKETRPFLRSREFMWQEGHTVHASVEEAQARTQQMLNVYADFCAEDLAIPVVKGRKTDKEKFAGATATYTIEALMHDSTRIIGALIMVHGDNSGLVLPPRIAPTQIMIVPIQQKKAGVLDKAFEIRDMLSNFRVKVDDSDKSPGFKFADQEMRGIPVRIEIGPRDIEGGKCIIARRDNHEKIECDIASLPEKMAELLPQIQKDMYDRAAKHLEEHTYTAASKEEFDRLFREKSGFVKAMWCGDQACEDMIKEDYGVTSRCMPFKQETVSDVCVCCGKPAKKMVYWGRAY